MISSVANLTLIKKRKKSYINQTFFFLAHFFLVGVEIFKQTLTTSCNELMF